MHPVIGAHEYSINMCGVPIYKLPCAEMTIIHPFALISEAGLQWIHQVVDFPLNSDSEPRHEKFVISQLVRKR